MKYDKLEAENLYITDCKQTYRSLAEKYGVSLYTIYNDAKKNNWCSKREKHKTNLQNKLYKKSIDSEVKMFDKIAQASLMNVNRICAELDADGLTTKDRQILTQTLKDSMNIFRSAKGILTAQEQSQLDIARHKLELEEKKLDINSNTIDSIKVVFDEGMKAYGD